MRFTIITRTYEDKVPSLRKHLAMSDSARPLCGGGRNGKKTKLWQSHIGGADTCDCVRCLRVAVRLLL